jgi:hypothetical protein
MCTIGRLLLVKGLSTTIFLPPVIGAFYPYSGVFRQPTKSCKWLETQVIKTLKWPASAVQSRLWPPHSKAVRGKLEETFHP